jgi:H+/Cl- antiporter ClcA
MKRLLIEHGYFFLALAGMVTAFFGIFFVWLFAEQIDAWMNANPLKVAFGIIVMGIMGYWATKKIRG